MKEVKDFYSDIKDLSLPKKFTFPFYYSPHELCKIAVKEVQKSLNEKQFNHPFGLDEQETGISIGKMFGVLIVENSKGDLKYLKAFSGKLSGLNNNIDDFVPPIQNDEMLIIKENKAKARVKEISDQIIEVESNMLKSHQSDAYLSLQKHESKLQNYKKEMAASKQARKKQRAKGLTHEQLNDLAKQSIFQKKGLKELNDQFLLLKEKFDEILAPKHLLLKELLNERKEILSSLQRSIQEDFVFLNANGETKNLSEIFNKYNKKPNSGTGECCAPKLLNFAYKNNLKPIAMAEFWWGAPPKNAIRKHKQFYPACTGRCGPILEFMLQGLVVDDNPMLLETKDLKYSVIFEDDHLLVVNKPAGLLTTPGKEILDSLQTRIQKAYPNLNHIMPIHRLDQGTSGLVIFVKDKETHKKMQYLLNNKLIKKTYEALLEGRIDSKSGVIELAIGLDHNNPPFQMVSSNGKTAKTEYKVIQLNNSNTMVEFSPITGRTHQLRIHSAHFKGLNSPIVGDDMYGVKSDRMYLHASKLEFKHPYSKEELILYSPSQFFEED